MKRRKHNVFNEQVCLTGSETKEYSGHKKKGWEFNLFNLKWMYTMKSQGCVPSLKCSVDGIKSFDAV